MSVNGFVRLFQKETETSPQKWYMEKRITIASLMLSHSDKSIDVIAEATGFCDRAHFSRSFKQIKGVGPSTYRKSQKNTMFA
jgi:transcriptional regulator GlxA family with amidase domain